MSAVERQTLAREVSTKMLELSKLINQLSPYYNEGFIRECLELHSQMLEHEAVSISELEGFNS